MSKLKTLELSAAVSLTKIKELGSSIRGLLRAQANTDGRIGTLERRQKIQKHETAQAIDELKDAQETSTAETALRFADVEEVQCGHAEATALAIDDIAGAIDEQKVEVSKDIHDIKSTQADYEKATSDNFAAAKADNDARALENRVALEKVLLGQEMQVGATSCELESIKTSQKLQGQKLGNELDAVRASQSALRLDVAQKVQAVTKKVGPQGKPGEKGEKGASVTKVKLIDNDLFVWLDGVKKRVGEIRLPVFSSGGGGGRAVDRSGSVPWHILDIEHIIIPTRREMAVHGLFLVEGTLDINGTGRLRVQI